MSSFRLIQKETYKKVLEVEHQAVVDARKIDQKEYLELQKEASLNADDYRAIKKYELIQETGVETVSTEQVHNQEMGFYNRLRGYYRATKGYELLTVLDNQKLSKLNNRDIVRENRTTLKPKADISHMIMSTGFGDILNIGKVTNSSEKVIDLVESINSKGWLIDRDMIFEVKDFTTVNQVKGAIATQKQERKNTLESIKDAKAAIKEIRQQERIMKTSKLQEIQQDYLNQVKVVRQEHRKHIKGITDISVIEQLRLEKESKIEQLRLEKESKIAKTKDMSKKVLTSAKTSVIELESKKTSVKKLINQEQIKLAETRKSLTKKYETRKVWQVQGDLAEILGNIIVQSPIELVTKLATAYGFKLVELESERDRGTGERVYKIMSGYQDVAGNHTTKPDELHPLLLNHWYRRDLVRIISRLINNETNEDREEVTLDNLDEWLSSKDTRLTKFLESLTGSGLHKNNSKI